MGYFADARNHKTSAFSRKMKGLCLLNVAVKESAKLKSTRNSISLTTLYI